MDGSPLIIGVRRGLGKCRCRREGRRWRRRWGLLERELDGSGGGILTVALVPAGMVTLRVKVPEAMDQSPYGHAVRGALRDARTSADIRMSDRRRNDREDVRTAANRLMGTVLHERCLAALQFLK